MSSDTWGVVSTGYFRTLQITTMAGYIFTASSCRRKSGGGDFFALETDSFCQESFTKCAVCVALASLQVSEEKVTHRDLSQGSHVKESVLHSV